MKTELKTYYATFMYKQPLRDYYVKIKAPNEEVARDTMFQQFGKEWMTVYQENDFENPVGGEIFLRELCVIVADPDQGKCFGKTEGY